MSWHLEPDFRNSESRIAFSSIKRLLSDWFGPKFKYKVSSYLDNDSYDFFFRQGFLARTFMIHEAAREGGGYLFNSSLPLPPASQTLTH